ncbi:hypothetical protein ACBY01_04990 [Sphingomonas sp. ac-8]|uniref:hypothetical protein n=1 Tax=Sphingomonas sp. ac-8 TaxID=3242977 RepID=UPI003A809244
MTNLSGSLVGLSMLTGTNSFLTYGTAGASVETRAVRQAKALFTTPATIAPWTQAPSSKPVSAQVSAIQAMKTIIDKPATGAKALPVDVETSFTTYKALDRLRLLAETASAATTSSAQRTLLEASFAKGLEDLQGYLSSAPSDKLTLAFGDPVRRAESVAVKAPAGLIVTEVAGQGVATARDAPLAGLTGTEQFRVTLSRTNASDSVLVNLAGTPQPPTLDSVAAAINAAIAAVPARNAQGEVVTGADGNPEPRWSGVSFAATKSDGKWGLTLKTNGIEQVSLDQIDARDAVMVATGVTGLDYPTATRIVRIGDAAGAMNRQALGTISAVDRLATERAEMAAEAKAASAKTTTKTSTTTTTTATPPTVQAATSAGGIVTDANGFSYVVGTTSGDLGSNLSDGGDDLVLTKLDSEGKQVWQRSLGASGTAQGAAVTLAPDGSIVVAGTVKGTFDGIPSDGDMLVARFDANGDEKFAKLVRATGADSASAVAVGADGSIYVGGQSATGGGDAFVTRFSASGALQERRTIDSGGTDRITALAIDGDGQLLALTREGTGSKLHRLDAGNLASELGSLDLGAGADARAIAVAADGSIAVAGATTGALPGSQVNATGGGRDGFVARIDAGLQDTSVTYLATAGDDQVDSVAFLNGEIYAGGRTSGDLGGTRQGSVDGFVSRIDAATGAVGNTSQFGQVTLRTEPVRVSAVTGGDTGLGALGLHRGLITPADSAKLVAQTSLRAGDEFSIRVGSGAVRKITVTADDTLTTLASRVRLITGSKATVSTPKSGDGTVLRIEPKPGQTIEFLAGAEGKDALAKLGLPETRVTVPAAATKSTPAVTPGGRYGLDLTHALRIDTAADAATALDRIKQAISVSQTGYRSLYWDAAKAARVDGVTGGSSTSIENAQLANYQAALDRLSSGTSTSTGFFGF